MQTSIATVSISGTLVEKLTAIQAAGFDGVEIFENDLLYFDGSPADVRRIAADLGLKIMLFQPFRDFEGVSAERLARNLDRVKRKFDLMHELGTDRILVCSNVQADTLRDDALIVDQLGALALAAQQADVIAGYEALAWGRHVNSYRHAWRLVDAVGHPNLGIVLDSFHTLSIDDPVDEIAAIPGERITFVQIADAPRLAMDVLEWSRHYRCFPGQGLLPVWSKPATRGRFRSRFSTTDFAQHPRQRPQRTGIVRCCFLRSRRVRGWISRATASSGPNSSINRLLPLLTSVFSSSNSQWTTRHARISPTGSANSVSAMPDGIAPRTSRCISTAPLRSC
jgi:sugar phosphate isomerase/epimerase